MLSKKSNLKILAIETSCDETAAAVIEKNDNDVKILSNVVSSQIDLHRQYGGVFPEVASRAHTEQIIPVVEKALLGAHKNIKTEGLKNKKGSYVLPFLREVDAVAVTTGPGLIGSLLVGVNFAKTLAYLKNLPIIGINHWLGHIYSNWLTADSLQQTAKNQAISRELLAVSLPQFPSLILIVSGGHTGLVLMKSHDEIIPLGETLDDAAGEAFDKVAKLLELGYPGGPAIAKAAEEYKASFLRKQESSSGSQLKAGMTLPRPMLNDKSYNFSFSGLKTAVLYLANSLQPTATRKKPKAVSRLPLAVSSAIAASFQQAAIDILVGKTIQAAYEFKPKSICICGGVSANKELREQLKKAVAGLPTHPSYHIPPLELTGDNAAMIGLAAAYHLDQKTSWDKINPDANLKL